MALLKKRGKVFGLSVTEEIEWGVCEASEGVLIGSIERGVFDGIPNGNLPHDWREQVDIQDLIRKKLVQLREDRPDLFQDIIGIGVSTIGVVDRKNLCIDSLVRKNWGIAGKPIIDFKALFLTPLPDEQPLFEGITAPRYITVQNDASARCKTELLYNIEPQSKNLGLLYIAVGEGINGAFARGGDIITMDRHAEMGHIFPQLHPDDLKFDLGNSGCPAHGTCFEGVVSNARIRQQYKANLSTLPANHSAWNIEAFYLAQLALTGALTLNPDRILFGGAVFAGEKGHMLIDMIRSQFLKRNASYLPDYRSKADVAKLIARAKFGNGVKILSALTMGCSAVSTATIDQMSATLVVLNDYQRLNRMKESSKGSTDD